jgi:type VI secretion system secreted protein VgrG
MANNPASEAKYLFELLDADFDLSVVGFDVTETVSDTFVVNLTLGSKDKITFEDVKLQEGLLTVLGGVGAIINDESGDRYFHGIIRKFKHSGTSGRFHLYDVQMVPSLWLLSLQEKCRIFQDKPLKEIIGNLLQEQDIATDVYEFRLDRADIFIKFSIQYQETNLNYLSRLLEHEGIFYFFEHYEDKHVLVFCDTEAFYQEITGQSSLTFNTNGLAAEKENVYAFDSSERLRPGKLSQKNYNFKRPSVDLSTEHKGESEKEYEVYEYPGPYGETGVGQKLSQIRLEEIQAVARRGNGSSCCPRLQPGATFTLSDHPHESFNDEYFLYTVTHEGEQPQILQEQGSGGSAHYSNSFTVIPASVIYRPERTTRKPMVPGLLSAVVTGPKGEEIWPDEYGRVNVQFHFDREGKRDEKSSCWLRTIQFWNGTTWGSQFIPRVGDEVLVSFINGDMDYPIITGSVVNEAKQPNYNLPANKTQSGIRTRSSPGGNPDNFNELRFEDKMGAEEVYLQGEKDWNILIKNDKGQRVGHDETLTVGNDRSKYVVVNQSESIGANKSIQVGINHTETIGSNMTLTVGNCKTETIAINSMETIGLAKELSIGGLYQVSVGGIMNETVACAKTEEVGLAKAVFVGATMTENVVGDRTTNIGADLSEFISGKYYSKANEYVIEAPKITFKAGSSTIVMDGSSITIKASKVFTN